MQRELVSIGIPTFNGEETIEKSIRSVLNQTYKKFELIISDNASIDKTPEICAHFKKVDSRVRYIRQISNISAIENFKAVFENSLGEFFMWLGDDDWIENDYIEKCVRKLEKNRDYGLIAGNCIYHDNLSSFSGEKIVLDQDNPYERVNGYFKKVKNNHIFYGLYRKSVIRDAWVADVFAADWIFISNIAMKCKIKNITETSIHRRFQVKSTYNYLRGASKKNLAENLIPYTFMSIRVCSNILQKMDSKSKKPFGLLMFLFSTWITLVKRFAKYDLLHIYKIRGEIKSKISVNSIRFFKLVLSYPYNLRYLKKWNEFREPGMPCMAFFAPLPPVRSGISDYSVDILNELKNKYDIDVFIDIDYTADSVDHIKIYPCTMFTMLNKRRNYDSIIYQIGNSRYHNYMYKYLAKYSGTVFLHDGLNFSYRKNKINLLSRSKIILHSRNTLENVVSNGLDRNATINIPQIMPIKDSLESILKRKREIRAKFEISDDTFVIGCFGIISPAKHVHSILSAVDSIFSEGENFIFLIVGHEICDDEVHQFLRTKGSSKNYIVKISPSLKEFYDFMAITDLCFNLRFPFRGETSAALLRLMSLAVPVVVTDIGSFSEFPDDCVIKTSSRINAEEYKSILLHANKCKAWRDSIGINAFNYVKDNHNPSRIRDLICEYIEK